MATLTLRIPDEMKTRIEQAAKADVRSTNEEIVWLLKVALLLRDVRPQEVFKTITEEGGPGGG